jgi:HK97 family phage prohead protease
VNHGGLPLARTASGTLELREDARGLHVFARLDKNDPDVISLRGKMQRGDVDQMSFAFTMAVDADEWVVTDDEQVIRTINPDGVDELFDVSVVTFPAYRHTEVSMRSVLQDAISRGRVPVTVEQAESLASDEDERAVAPVTVEVLDAPATTSSSKSINVTFTGSTMDAAEFEESVRRHLQGGSTEVAEETPGEEHDAAPDEVDVEQAADLTAALKESVRASNSEARESYLRLLKEHGLT